MSRRSAPFAISSRSGGRSSNPRSRAPLRFGVRSAVRRRLSARPGVRVGEPIISARHGLGEQSADEGQLFIGQERVEDEPDAAAPARPAGAPGSFPRA